MKAKPIPDNSPEARERRARAKADAEALASIKRREAEIEAMGPEERIAVRLVERAGGDIYRPAYESLVADALANGGISKDPRGAAHRSEKVVRNARAVLLRRLQEDEAQRAGVGGHAPTGRMSMPMTRKAIHALVRTRYPRDTKNLERWWQRRIVKAGIVIDEEHYRAVSIDLGQLIASLPERRLTEADIAPYLA